jgi:micrococcal nuclease
MRKHLVAMRSAAIFALLMCAVTARAEQPRTVYITVERVVDGDTLIATSANATKLRIRLIGIDAPEIAHHRNPGQPFGFESRRYLERLILNRPVRLEMFSSDRYRRILAVAWTGDTNVNIQMVRVGFAEVYRGSRCQAYCRELVQAEAEAQRERKGIWSQDQHESPSAYRKRAGSA